MDLSVVQWCMLGLVCLVSLIALGNLIRHCCWRRKMKLKKKKQNKASKNKKKKGSKVKKYAYGSVDYPTADDYSYDYSQIV